MAAVAEAAVELVLVAAAVSVVAVSQLVMVLSA